MLDAPLNMVSPGRGALLRSPSSNVPWCPPCSILFVVHNVKEFDEGLTDLEK
jgi:hypothetical protein